ncbi:hypothetical protein [Paenibacillus alvei]|uniref:Uncharacterized protein n=1 Tax=Paenibacillus alvei TaxID=44250 RepID=A0ABT4H6S0_PAEAL|nr:hypothetical protein [Paenibacillus alvei]MCY9764685.1 hypothetical protein [Paenibacillus alvei]
MFDIDVYKNGVRAVPRRDIAAEDAGRKPSDVIERKMTPEERERMEKIGPYKTYNGKHSKIIVPGVHSK